MFRLSPQHDKYLADNQLRFHSAHLMRLIAQHIESLDNNPEILHLKNARMRAWQKAHEATLRRVLRYRRDSISQKPLLQALVCLDMHNPRVFERPRELFCNLKFIGKMRARLVKKQIEKFIAHKAKKRDDKRHEHHSKHAEIGLAKRAQAHAQAREKHRDAQNQPGHEDWDKILENDSLAHRDKECP